MSTEHNRFSLTLSEIYNQTRACQESIDQAEERLRLVETLLPFDRYTDILLTGCGSSLHIAHCAAYAWSEIIDRPVRAVTSSEIIHFADHYLARDAQPLVIAISRSGATTEVQLAVERLRHLCQARAIAITGESGGPVADACDVEVTFTECPEQSVVMTQAFTCMLTGLYLLADGATGWRHGGQIGQIPSLISAALDRSEQVARTRAEDVSISRFVFLGSGCMKGLADECALKMTEMALMATASYHLLEVRHGPKAALDPSVEVVIFTVPAEHRYLDALLKEVSSTGARLLVVSGDVREQGLTGVTDVTLGEELADVFRPALYAHIGQLLACWRAMGRGLSPDAPPHLTRTVLLDG